MDTDSMIFVFGSNTGGIHGAGAARYAHAHRGATYGVGVGPSGQSYAIPTKGAEWVNGKPPFQRARTLVVGDTLTLNIIEKYVKEFLEYAEHHKELQFQVTCIGCGLAGLRHDDIAPMFANEDIDNLWFDTLWQPILGDGYRYWGTI